MFCPSFPAFLCYTDYVDENGNLLEDFELPAPAGCGKPVGVTAGPSSSSGRSAHAAAKPPGSDMLSQQQQQQQQQLEIQHVAVDGAVVNPMQFGGEQAVPESWHQQRLIQQQQQQHGQMWTEQQQQQMMRQQLWQQQRQQGHPEQAAAAAHGGSSRQLLQSGGLPSIAAVNTVAPQHSDIADQAAMILAQRGSGQLLTDAQHQGEMHNPAAACNFRQPGVTVTTSVGFDGNSSGITAGSYAAAIPSGHGRFELPRDMQQQQQQQQQRQQMMPELTVAELNLPPLVPHSSFAATSSATAMQQQQQQQVPSMPSYCMQPSPQQQQQGAPWQQQQLAGNSGQSVLNSFGSTSSIAQQYAQQASMAQQQQLQMTGSVNAVAPLAVSAPAVCSPLNSHASLNRLGSGCSAQAMGQPMLQPAMQANPNTNSRQPPAPAAAAAVTHALSARMASCELQEALQLARQAAAAQGVSDLPGALRQMSSAQLPVVTTSSGGSLQAQQQQQQQQQLSSAGTVSSSGHLLQGHGSGVSFGGVSSMTGAAAIGQPAMQQAAGFAVAAQPAAAAAAAAAAAGSPIKHALTPDSGAVCSTGVDSAAGPASKRARTSSLHDDVAAALNSS
jgi:hypothetical protein